MWRNLLASMCVACLVAAPARADVVEIPLPGLLGAYPASRTVTVQLPQVPDEIHGAALRITGTASVGLADCGQAGEINLWPLEFITTMEDTPGNEWLAAHELSFLPGLFTRTTDFEPQTGTTTWAFLMDGEGEIRLSGAPWTQLTVCSAVTFPAGTLTEAVLIVDAAFPLAVELSTWGRIKALYR